MTTSNHYEVLQVNPTATQAEIKQSYRRLVKLFHPDSNKETSSHEQIVRLNAAYEVLSDPQLRQSYDKQIYNSKQTINRESSFEKRSYSYSYDFRSTQTARTQQYQRRQTGQDAELELKQWIERVYKPVNQMLSQILNPLKTQIDYLSADPFDDELLAAFQSYINTCRNFLNQAQERFRSLPNPSPVAGIAAHLYYCLNHIGDGIEELEFYSLNYDERHLHTAQELFRMAADLRREAQAALKKNMKF
ncbi:MAG: DnaJ domain-containing protein [Oscillatoriaceae bacterium SKW80]|nr:DnaJ domain-containing protein [Oscillatoriaceae bacterium SKYG93]MCX8122340.1 DnaJ domain-containing protein [Oscillatoriaceae bacterium SKW80]MDW8452448.1 DnaJ domain-containing protein [Oscillatoriaceae cyanobacterium SKYGB_i_bin93]HIK27727.1 DnaJ domain-containing protein [Oscillatoriaceae cyanobacterium M7585_C2015_266]